MKSLEDMTQQLLTNDSIGADDRDSSVGSDSTPSITVTAHARGGEGAEGPLRDSNDSKIHNLSNDRFDRFSGDTTHTQSQDAGAADEMPWDSFLEEASTDDAYAD